MLASECAAVNVCDVLAGMDGAFLTKLLFLQPGRTAVHQVAPLGVPPVARGSYEKAMNMMGMQYEQYDTAEKESSLVCKYAADDVVVHVMGWVR
ncbi:glycosyltransferase [Hordeum vulgare]|nr:glycosyltransferase [Hordeum vulgare]